MNTFCNKQWQLIPLMWPKSAYSLWPYFYTYFRLVKNIMSSEPSAVTV